MSFLLHSGRIGVRGIGVSSSLLTFSCSLIFHSVRFSKTLDLPLIPCDTIGRKTVCVPVIRASDNAVVFSVIGDSHRFVPERFTLRRDRELRWSSFRVLTPPHSRSNRNGNVCGPCIASPWTRCYAQDERFQSPFVLSPSTGLSSDNRRLPLSFSSPPSSLSHTASNMSLRILFRSLLLYSLLRGIYKNNRIEGRIWQSCMATSQNVMDEFVGAKKYWNARLDFLIPV